MLGGRAGVLSDLRATAVDAFAAGAAAELGEGARIDGPEGPAGGMVRPVAGPGPGGGGG